MSIKKLSVSVVAIFAVALSLAPVVNATGNHGDHKIGICHATGSRTNPYVFIRVDKHAAEAHERHHDGRDVIGANSKADCPTAIVASTTKPVEEHKDSEKSPEVMTVPKELPSTGPEAAFAAVTGASALGYATTAFVRSRRSH